MTTIKPKTATAAVFLLAAAALTSCASEEPSQEKDPAAAGASAGNEDQPTKAAEDGPACVTEFDLDQMEAALLSDEDAVGDGYAFLTTGGVVAGDASPYAPVIVKGGNLSSPIPVTRLPGQERIEVISSQPTAGGFIVGSWAASDSAMDPEEPPGQLSKVSYTGETQWSIETPAVGAPYGTIIWSERWDVAEGVVDGYTMEVVNTVTEVDQVQTPTSFASFDAATGDPVTLDTPLTTLVEDDNDDDPIRTDDFMLKTGDGTSDDNNILRGSREDGSQEWERVINDDFQSLAACGQYVYVSYDDGIHVLDQTQQGEETALIPNPVNAEGLNLDGDVQPRGFLIFENLSEEGSYVGSMPQ